MVTIRVPFKRPVASVSTPNGSVVAAPSPTPNAEAEQLRSDRALKTLEGIAAIVQSMAEEQDRQFSEAKQQLALAAIEVCRQVLGEDSELLQQRVQHFVDLAIQENAAHRSTTSLTAFVHPTCVSMIQNWTLEHEMTNLHCKPDATLAPGDCRVESEGKGIAASLDAFLEATMMRLEGVRL
ncbi:MAG: FliH/SctL family protein [Planctomycetota bacterium]